MQRRLTYANVMATLAFFFSLTGGTMAAARWLEANDPISQGDLAGSTYGNPVIAAGAVTAGKIADGTITSAKFDSTALAPNADKLDGKDSTAFPTIVTSGSVTLPYTELGGNSCFPFVGPAPSTVDPTTDYIVVQANEDATNWILASGTFLVNSLGGLEMGIKICNVSALVVNVAGTYRYLVLR